MKFKSLQDLIKEHLSNVKVDPHGVLNVNAPCCIHNGETPDTRHRGGFKCDNSSVMYNCFNCKYKFIWKEGSLLSKKAENMLYWLGCDTAEVKTLKFNIWRVANDQNFSQYASNEEKIFVPFFNERPLPPKTKSFLEIVENNEKTQDFEDVFNYVLNRNKQLLNNYDFYYSSTMKGYLIIPYMYNEKIVGWTARNVHKKRFLKDLVPDFILNIDKVANRKIIVVCEGTFDALSIDAVSPLGSHFSDNQIKWLNSLNKKIIVVPDIDKQGTALVNQAIENDWNVSIPMNVGRDQWWDRNIKDVSAATEKYGKLYVLNSIIQNSTNNKLVINSKLTFNKGFK